MVFVSVKMLWLRLVVSWTKPPGLICNFQQLINHAGPWWFGCPPVPLQGFVGGHDCVQVFGWWCRAGKTLLWTFSCLPGGCAGAQAFATCLGPPTWHQTCLNCGWPMLLSPHPALLVQVLCGAAHLGGEATALLALPASQLWRSRWSLVLPNNCVLPAGKLSLWVSHTKLLELLPGLLDLRTFAFRGFLRVSVLNFIV